MEDTGRLHRPVSATAQRILFGAGDTSWSERLLHLHLTSQVDQAHLVMLVEQGLIDRGRARQLLAAIAELQANGFAPLRGLTASRGLYLLYEDYLIRQCGAAIGGMLQTARSRNDLGATVFRLWLRAPYATMLTAVLRLLGVLIRRADRYRDVVMPAYTHGQPALPSTYGHYLSGVAFALVRDAHGLHDAARELAVSPLGAGAVAGTAWPIDPSRTAALLGFEAVTRHSVDAVASRDLALRLLSAAAICAVTASRIAADLLQWSTLEFGFFELPDDIVGSSSAMPQKRNPFLLEHVIGKAGLIAGMLQGALMAMHAAPFSNAIAVGTEGIGPLWTGLRELKGALTLLRLFVARARPRPDVMAASVSRGFTTALLLADHLVATRDLDFRTAHTRVGRAVSAAASQGEHATLGGSALFWQNGDAMAMPAWVDDPRAAVARLRYGHGPAPDCAPATLAHLRDEWQQLSRRRIEWTRVWQKAERDLRAAVAQI